MAEFGSKIRQICQLSLYFGKKLSFSNLSLIVYFLFKTNPSCWCTRCKAVVRLPLQLILGGSSLLQQLEPFCFLEKYYHAFWQQIFCTSTSYLALLLVRTIWIQIIYHCVTILQIEISPKRCCHFSNSSGPGHLGHCVITIKESKSWFDLVATTNHSQDFTNNKHCVNHGNDQKCKAKQLCIKAWKYSVYKSCGEDELIGESMSSYNPASLIFALMIPWKITDDIHGRKFS